MGYNKRMRKDERGIVSIITVMLLAIVLAITTTSFLRLMLRANRQVVDSTLSSQAYYAAETGLEDAIKVLEDLRNGLPAVLNDTDGTDCKAASSTNVLVTSDNLGNGSYYSCQLIDPKPTLLNKTLQEYESWLVNIQGNDAAGTPIDVESIEIEWSKLPSDPDLVARAQDSSDLQSDAAWKGETSGCRRCESKRCSRQIQPL